MFYHFCFLFIFSYVSMFILFIFYIYIIFAVKRSFNGMGICCKMFKGIGETGDNCMSNEFC